MTAHIASPPTTTERTYPAWPALAAAAVGYEVVLTALGTFVDFNGNDPGKHDSIAAYLILVGIIGALAAVVFGLVVRTATDRTASHRATVLAVLAVPASVAFWTGAPVIFAVGSIACVLAGRSASGRMSKVGTACIAVAGLSIAFATLMAFVG